MIKTFIFGILLGIVGAGAALYYLPVVDQHREQSLISVAPNGGNTEVFHVNVPMDRVMIGAPGQDSPLPSGLQWPEDVELAGLRAELFKLRNAKDTVVGVASRMAASSIEAGDMVEWVLHLPARGSVYITMRPEATAAGYRVGELRAGSREFNQLVGQVMERWIAGSESAEEGPAGRIELTTAFNAVLEDR